MKISFADNRKALLQETLDKAERDGRILGRRGLEIFQLPERFTAETLRILRDLCEAYDENVQAESAELSEDKIAATISAALDRVSGSKTVVTIEHNDKALRIERTIDARPGFSEFRWSAYFAFDDIRAARVRALFANQTAFGASHRHVVIPARRTDHRFKVSIAQGGRTEELAVPQLILEIDSERDGLDVRSAILALCEKWRVDPDP